MGDRTLLVWIDNAEVSGKTKAIEAALIFPW
jgi:hypothetical protein